MNISRGVVKRYYTVVILYSKMFIPLLEYKNDYTNRLFRRFNDERKK